MNIPHRTMSHATPADLDKPGFLPMEAQLP
jgi:hypothetical protein